MLQLLRSGLTSYFATALLGLLIASFALWGIGGDILTGSRSDVAQIGDEKLSMQDYAREFQNNFSQYQQQTGSKVSREILINQGIGQRWVVNMVQRRAFAYAAHDLNIRVTDRQLRKYIMNIDAFQDTLGQFSKSKFENIARYQGHSTGEFEKILRRGLERQVLMTSLVSGIAVPDVIKKTLIKYLLEKRTAEIVTVPASAIKDIPKADEDALKKYYQDNYARYIKPEYRDIRFITLSPDDFIKDVTVTAAEIDQAMGSPAKTTAKDEKRDFAQVLFDSKKDADKAYTDLKAGRSFADIITAPGSSAGDATGSSFNKQDTSDTYGAKAAAVIFATKSGEYTAPVSTEFGWRIFNITKITAAAAKTEDLRTEAEQQVKKEKATDLLYKKTDQINDELAAGSSLSALAKKLSLTVKVASDINSTGYNSKGSRVADLPADPGFLVKVFAASRDEDPVLEELNNGNYYLLVVDNIKKTALRPFKDVKTAVLDGWNAQTRMNMAKKKARDIQKKSEKDSSLKEISTTTPATSYTSVTLGRNDQTGKVTKSIQKSIFSLEAGTSKILPAADGNGYVVVKLISRDLSNKSMAPAQLSEIKKALTQEYQQRILDSYWNYLEIELPVKINQAAVKAVLDQMASREQ